MPVLSLLLKHINPGNAVNQVNTAVPCPIDMCGTNVAPLTQLTSPMSPLTQPMSMLPHNRGSVKESLQCKDINQVNILKYLFPDAWRANGGKRRVCWLPHERRSGGRIASRGELVCIGAASGVVTILDFSDLYNKYNDVNT
jgi:hypothetical protein